MKQWNRARGNLARVEGFYHEEKAWLVMGRNEARIMKREAHRAERRAGKAALRGDWDNI